jgi:hypothetical protein
VVAAGLSSSGGGGGASDASGPGPGPAIEKVQACRFSRQAIHDVELGKTVQRDGRCRHASHGFGGRIGTRLLAMVVILAAVTGTADSC